MSTVIRSSTDADAPSPPAVTAAAAAFRNWANDEIYVFARSSSPRPRRPNQPNCEMELDHRTNELRSGSIELNAYYIWLVHA